MQSATSAFALLPSEVGSSGSDLSKLLSLLNYYKSEEIEEDFETPEGFWVALHDLSRF